MTNEKVEEVGEIMGEIAWKLAILAEAIARLEPVEKVEEEWMSMAEMVEAAGST